MHLVNCEKPPGARFIFVEREGRCSDEPCEMCVGGMEDWICGVDGKSYFNECSMLNKNCEFSFNI